MPNPQNRPGFNKPGCYDLVFRRPRTEVTPGEDAEVELYITGYGMISGAKLYFVPPANFIDPGLSWVEYDLGPREDGIRFGATRRPMGDRGFAIDLSSGGIKPPHWSKSSLFFDAGVGIATEDGTPEPPVKLVMKTKKEISTGDHNLIFSLTYFNGLEWRMAYRAASLHVPTLYERYEGWAWIAGIIVAMIATVASVIAVVGPLTSGTSSPASSHRQAVSHPSPTTRETPSPSFYVPRSVTPRPR